MRNAYRITLASVIAVALTLTGFSMTAATAQVRHITVSAEGKVSVTPDAVRIYSTVSLVANTSKIALEQANATSERVRSTLLSNGVERRDFRTQSLTVYPEYDNSQERGSTLIGYRASQAFDITIRNAANAGLIVDTLVAVGGNELQVNSVSPFILNAANATESARENAVNNARAKARSYASLLEVKLGRVLSLSEGSTPTFGGPIFAMEKNDAGATVIDLGQQEVSVTITVKWSIR